MYPNFYGRSSKGKVVLIYVVKVYRWSKGIAILILDFGTGW
jgi:hypothetical protein